MSPLSLLGLVLFDPAQFRKMVLEKPGPRNLRGLFVGTWVLFTAYISLFCYTRTLTTTTGEPLFLLGGDPASLLLSKVLNQLCVAAAGAVIFLAWYLFDRIWVYGLFARHAPPDSKGKSGEVKSLLIASYLPLVLLLGVWAFVRVSFSGSYILWGLAWVPFVTVSVTLAWHYGLLYYFLAGMGSDASRLHRHFGAWMVTAAGFLIGFLVAASFIISKSNPGEVMSRIF